MPDRVAILRALRRAVYTDKMLTLEAAWRYLDVQGIPREALGQNSIHEMSPPERPQS